MLRFAIIISLLCGAILLCLFLLIPEPSVPSFAEVRAAYRPSDAVLLDRSGEIIHEVRLDFTRRRLAWTPLSEISPALQKAVIASEDRHFYQHDGVDRKALLAAGLGLLSGRPRGGASTIPMQLATLSDPRLRRALQLRGRAQGFSSRLYRKFRQMQIAWAIARHWSKAQMLEAYLNLVPFRGELEGVTAAAHRLFGKAPHGISEAEALVLAVLLRAPNATPDVVVRRAWALRERTAVRVSQEAVTKAVSVALYAAPATGPRVTLAPHVASRLLRSAQPGRPVRSTLDVRLQRVATEVLRHHLLAVRERRVRDGAVLVVDTATGEVLAYVGGSGVLSSARYVDGVRAGRQAGSTLKPFLYGLALEKHILTPASLLEDEALALAVAGGLYRPQNYDQHFRGLVSVRTALGASLNVPAVRTLELIGAEIFVQQLRRLGFAGLSESGDYYGPSLALGSADVSLWELVNAYRTLANGGVWGPLRMTFDEVRSPQSALEQRLYSEGTAFLLSHILSDRESRSATFGLENPLATRFWSAVKTGTSKEMRDNWCIGYSQRYTVGVWVGNFSGEPMREVSGITGAAPVWLALMEWLHRTARSSPPQPPAGVLVRAASFPNDIEPPREEWFLQGTEPQALTQTLARSRPHVLAPVSGTVIALDPDMPPAQQRVVFEAETAGRPLRWTLDGIDVGSATRPIVWSPRPGKHTLSLGDEHSRLLDTVTFEVRGASPGSLPVTAASQRGDGVSP